MLIKLTDTKRKERKEKFVEEWKEREEKTPDGGGSKREKINKQNDARWKNCPKNWVEINFSRVLFSFCDVLFLFLALSLDIYLIDFRMRLNPLYEFPSPLDHALQSTERYAGPKIRCHLKEWKRREEKWSLIFLRFEIIFVHARLNWKLNLGRHTIRH